MRNFNSFAAFILASSTFACSQAGPDSDPTGAAEQGIGTRAEPNAEQRLRLTGEIVCTVVPLEVQGAADDGQVSNQDAEDATKQAGASLSFRFTGSDVGTVTVNGAGGNTLYSSEHVQAAFRLLQESGETGGLQFTPTGSLRETGGLQLEALDPHVNTDGTMSLFHGLFRGFGPLVSYDTTRPSSTELKDVLKATAQMSCQGSLSALDQPDLSAIPVTGGCQPNGFGCT